MKIPITLRSLKNKTPEQLAKEVFGDIQKLKKIKDKVEKKEKPKKASKDLKKYPHLRNMTGKKGSPKAFIL